MLGVLFERNTFSWLSTYFSLTSMLSKESSTFFFLFSVECLSLIMKCSSFQVAAENNFVECIHALFNNTSVLVDALNGIDEKETALHLASKHGYCDAAEALLQ